MFGLSFQQMLALASDASEMVEMSKELAAVYQKHAPMVGRVMAVLGGERKAEVPHAEAARQVKAIVSKEIETMERSTKNVDGG